MSAIPSDHHTGEPEERTGQHEPERRRSAVAPRTITRPAVEEQLRGDRRRMREALHCTASARRVTRRRCGRPIPARLSSSRNVMRCTPSVAGYSSMAVVLLEHGGQQGRLDEREQLLVEMIRFVAVFEPCLAQSRISACDGPFITGRRRDRRRR